MGNDQIPISKKDLEAKQNASFLKQRNSAKLTSSTLSVPSRNSEFGLEKKWKAQLITTLNDMSKQPKWKELAKDIKDIVKSISQQMFIKAVTTINAIQDTPINEFQTTVVKRQQKQQQFNPRISVLVVVQETYPQSEDNNSPQITMQKKSQQSIRKQIGSIIRKELNQKYHPVNQIKQSFMMIFQMKFRQMLDSDKSRTWQTKQKINELMFIDIDFFCQLVVKGCTLYKPWILKLTGIKQSKYVGFAKKMIVQSLFSKHSMHEKIFPFLLELNKQYINSIIQKIPHNFKISYFKLNSQLQIQQNYHGAMMAFSQIDSFTSPRRTLQQLTKIKLQICNDVQNYHEHFKTGQIYSIDGDNMLGIMCFMLCKLKAKMLHIFCQLQLLSVAYGDNLASAFESASYMVSAINAAFDFLASPDFGN